MICAARRGLGALLALALVAVTALVLPTVAPSPASAQESFYTPPSPLPAGNNGDVIKSQRVNYSNATATRLMYLSRDIRNQPIPVTGTVLVPNTAWPGGGPRPIVAYAPFTAGMGDQCAVSHYLAGESWGDLSSGTQTGFINALLAKGIAVAQTDYQGLGTPGNHTYMMRGPQGRAVLDVIRAAQRLPGSGLPTNGPVGVAGYSQGGSASAAAAELAPSYAPELNVAGVYVGAPGADLSVLARTLDGSFYAGFLGFALIGIEAGYPNSVLSRANDAGRQFFQQANTVCTIDAVFGYAYRQTSTFTTDGRPVSAYLTEEPYRTIMAENKLGAVRPTAPTLVEHSSLDDVLPFAQGQQMARDWCSRGATVQFNDLFTFIPLFAHLLQASPAATNAANWLAGRFNGTAPTTNCGRI
jgi:secretory lipase